MTHDTVYLVFWKPQAGLPSALGKHSDPRAALDQMDTLVAQRTRSGWAVLPSGGAQPGADRRDVLLRRGDGVIESFYITEHHHEVARGGATSAA